MYVYHDFLNYIIIANINCKIKTLSKNSLHGTLIALKAVKSAGP